MEVCNLLPPFNNINKFGLSEGLSFNSVDTNEKIIKMSEAVKNGAYALHGVKTKKVFEKISNSDFLLNGSFVSFDWIFKQQNFLKILEGNYDNKTPNKKNHG